MNALLSLLASIPSSAVEIPKAEINNAQLQGAISVILAVAGVVAVIFIILGGLRYTISQGNPQDLEKGKNMIIYALVGLFFVMFAFLIVQFISGEIF
ncbi:TPA: hypothetical protein DCF80_02610 [Candidatus Saccharibacteria bacterium]|nr:hypothetical protein [Candidatus Saccharibacteria bacterium]HRK40573.1 pilin [Candidatus Saccharibacteria bacterium]